MRRRPRLLLDCDGVLTHGFVEEACRLLAEEGVSAAPHQVDRWDLMAALSVPDDIQRRVYDRMKAPGVAMRFAPIEGSQAFVAECERWADVYMVTSPMGGPYWKNDREDWLYTHYKTPARRVAQIHDKFIVYGDAFVDDKLEHLVNWSSAFPHGLAVLWRIPPNRNDHWPVEAATYDDLRERLEHVRLRFA